VDTPVIVPDGRAAVVTALRATLLTRTDPCLAGITSDRINVLDMPTDDADASGEYLPYVQVKTDGSTRTTQLDTYDTIRLVFWGIDDGLTTQLARLTEAIILAYHDETIRGCVSQQSVFSTYDPDNGRPMAYITFTARLRPSNLN
jgi:hypothetical protein